MASLNTFLTRRQLSPVESNLEEGQVSVYTNSNEYTSIPYGFCWRAPGNGTAIIEIWGSGGSSAQMCCCGGSLPGNSGAYVKKTIYVCSGSYACGSIGFGCGNASALCYRGKSDATCLCWIGNSNCNTPCGCLCAEGGMGGYSYCSTGTPVYCCFRNGTFCASQDRGEACGCGTVCNIYQGWNGACAACAYGGDINCTGLIGCVTFHHWQPVYSDGCYGYFHVPVPPGIISTEGAYITFGKDFTNTFSNWSGQGYHQFISSLNVASRFPGGGIPYTTCFNWSGSCGGYQTQGCSPHIPPGMGAVPGIASCSGYSDYGWRGGQGLVRIKYLNYFV